MPKSPSINLLNKVSASSSIDQVLSWALSIGRWIVIVTELIVIAAFLGRFWLDMRLNTLKEDIETQKNLIQAFAQVESEFRQVQKRINSVADALKAQPDVRHIFGEFNKSFPQTTDLSINQLNWNKNTISINGEAVDEKTISIFENNLRASPIVESVQLTNVSLKVDDANHTSEKNVYEFSLVANISK